jgi:septal ring factor EnvC (AmiA/AmiB activator)
MELLKAKYAGGWTAAPEDEETTAAAPVPAAPSGVAAPSAVRPSAAAHRDGNDVSSVQRELAVLRQEVAQMRQELNELHNAQLRTADELQSLREALGG